MCIVTTRNSTAGLRNATSSDTLSRDLLGTTVVQYNAPLLQSISSDAVRDHVRVQFATICSRRAGVKNLTSYVHIVSSRVSDWTSSYNNDSTLKFRGNNHPPENAPPSYHSLTLLAAVLVPSDTRQQYSIVNTASGYEPEAVRSVGHVGSAPRRPRYIVVHKSCTFRCAVLL